MPAAVLDLVDSRQIEANSYWSMEVFYPGNMLRSRLKGQIRKELGGDLIGNFKFDNPVYDEITDQTRFHVFFRSSETEKFPIPEPDEFWVYDLLILLPNGDYQRILKGKVAVDPGVTDV
ncbi:MAG: hypothetical protein KME07_07290 [Pegethrix bostrychoides GSE-TBD4-15B]|jgi:hypothetical protein|uniref:Uncharacterized protein n=1 Tax=Pegethrix bostrychoides GSE-TBD4-15B TaxID=2839662 RepID=A0A951PA74_9CYAN|nr:hypothetical protein [Pegethrix bostrychoides GSE-TBD4-15B]